MPMQGEPCGSSHMAAWSCIIYVAFATKTCLKAGDIGQKL